MGILLDTHRHLDNALFVYYGEDGADEYRVGGILVTPFGDFTPHKVYLGMELTDFNITDEIFEHENFTNPDMLPIIKIKIKLGSDLKTLPKLKIPEPNKEEEGMSLNLDLFTESYPTAGPYTIDVEDLEPPF